MMNKILQIQKDKIVEFWSQTIIIFLSLSLIQSNECFKQGLSTNFRLLFKVSRFFYIVLQCFIQCLFFYIVLKVVRISLIPIFWNFLIQRKCAFPFII